MARSIGIAKGALLLTGVNFILRGLGTGFQVYLSRKIGAAGLGVLQLTMSVGSFVLVAGMGGIRTATMYLTAGELGRKSPEKITGVLSGCLAYSLIISGICAVVLWFASPNIGAGVLGSPTYAPVLRLYSAFLMTNCLGGVFQGYFTAAGKIRVLTAVEIAEQIFSMAITVLLLAGKPHPEPIFAAKAVITGSGCGGMFCLISLCTLRLREGAQDAPDTRSGSRVISAALPLAAADTLKAAISSFEQILVPRRLALCSRIPDSLAAFGVIGGMVFPALMFPACLLFGLSELLIPEFARCQAGNRQERIHALAKKSLVFSLVYGFSAAGVLWLLAKPIGIGLYKNADASVYLRRFAPLAAMLYCDIITDAAIKGLGKQKYTVLNNIFTNLIDIAMLYFLLPSYGLSGYFLSFTVSHGINFALSLFLLSKALASEKEKNKSELLSL